MAHLGLRGKSLVALILACLLALVPAGLAGWLAVDNVREHFGAAYARNFTQLNLQRILGPLSRELALSRRLANSELTHQWLRAENDPARRATFFREAESYRRDLADRAYFLVSESSGNYYYNDDEKPFSDASRYTLERANPKDSWFYVTVMGGADYTLNINTDRELGLTRIWLNVLIKDGDTPLGLAGASLDLSDFLSDFVNTGEVGVTPVVLDANGAIQAHPDKTRIALNSAIGPSTSDSRLSDLVDDTAGKDALHDAMLRARAERGSVQALNVTMEGRPQLLALAFVPELNWYVVTAVDLRAAKILDRDWMLPTLLTLVLLLGALLLGFGYLVERLVLSPLRRLQHSARAIAQGRYEVSLPNRGKDEIGDLTRAFGMMADKVRSHTAELESKVRERTSALEAANREMAVAQKKIGDSIDYASLIQQAILPDRQLTQSLGVRHFVLWKPRDVVGGDFYVFHADGANCLLGVVDCAGHGVPGALMTMLARAAIDGAIAECGPRDPAAILARTDQTLRSMLADAQLPRALATNLDAGLVYVDREAKALRFAGAKISLYASDGEQVREFKGGRRGLFDRREPELENIALDLSQGWTFYLSTDGFLDQSGGDHGFGFGNTRFTQMVKECARMPLAEQAEAFAQRLTHYQGENPQRDDITILAFRFD
ncbi:Serine phosphatase RsbU, regulator of sigma subunit [plant metagenome]|uniref:Serine phosphatase RsbU, regulator of sigma subunit n=1 Tax=plant metagenome TaxID=1297885 RepID=A0A484V3R6_9ZZZZ